MSRFINNDTGVTVSVADEKDHRFAGDNWRPADEPAPKSRRKSSKASKAAASSEPTVADLKAEIERRNAGRDEDHQIPATGKKADLLAALDADDNPVEPDEDDGEFLDDDELDDDAVEQFIAADGTAG